MIKYYRLHIDGQFKTVYVNQIELKRLIRTHVVRGVKRIYA
jgi:hypothetical protein